MICTNLYANFNSIDFIINFNAKHIHINTPKTKCKMQNAYYFNIVFVKPCSIKDPENPMEFNI